MLMSLRSEERDVMRALAGGLWWSCGDREEAQGLTCKLLWQPRRGAQRACPGPDGGAQGRAPQVAGLQQFLNLGLEATLAARNLWGILEYVH